MTMKRGMKWSRIGRFVSCHLPGVWSGEDGEVPLSSAVSRTRGEKESIGARVGTPRRGGRRETTGEGGWIGQNRVAAILSRGRRII